MTDWQPIETAPKDGTRVDLWTGGRRVTGAFYKDDGWTVWVRWVRDKRQTSGGLPTGTHRYTGVDSPTHWMPLPEPPE